MDTLDKLLNKAKDFLDENPGLNEVTLTDGSMQVKVLRVTPSTSVWWSSGYQWPPAGTGFYQP